MSRRGVANRLCRHAIAPKSLRKPIPSYPAKAGLEGTSGIAVDFRSTLQIRAEKLAMCD